MEFSFSLAEIADAAQKILDSHPARVILFNGQMGAGKTTLIREICRTLHVQDNVGSPTFSLVNEYLSEDGIIYHFDLYRINCEREAMDIGIEEYFYSGHYCFVEWSEKIPGLIPPAHTKINISELPDGKRLIQMF